MKAILSKNHQAESLQYTLGHKIWGEAKKRWKKNPILKKWVGHRQVSAVAKSVASISWETGLEVFAWVEEEKCLISSNGQKLGSKQSLLENILQTWAIPPASFPRWSFFLCSIFRMKFSFPLPEKLQLLPIIY